MKKLLYAAPETEVLELRLEGVIAVSGGSDSESIPEEGGSW